jgi:hypothetical protein
MLFFEQKSTLSLLFQRNFVIIIKMISSKIKKIYPIAKESVYYKAELGNEFPLKQHIIQEYGYAPCFYNFETNFTSEVLDFLLEKGELVNFYNSGKFHHLLSGDVEKTNGGFFIFKYKDIFIKLMVKSFSNAIFDEDTEFSFFEEGAKKEKRTFHLTFFGPANIKDYYFKDFEKFILNDSEEVKVHLFIKNQYGDYNFEPISINLPKNLDLELNYGKEFLDIDKKIQERLFEKPNGLFMFHGLPGTGKTTYIKYLASQVKRDFIYIPTTMIEFFTSDPNCLHTLIQKPNSIIILEDAEKAILKRLGDGMDSSAVSSLLNLSDGILSDILKTSVIVTYNCPKQDVDDALKRKGRLQMDYEFTALTTEDAKKLAKSLKYSKKTIDSIENPLTLSEIYNIEKITEFYGETKTKTEKQIGFAT